MFSLAVYATRDHHHVHHQHVLTSFVLNGSRHLLQPWRARFCIFQSTFDRAQAVSVAQLPRLANSTLVHRLSEFEELIIYIYTPSHLEHVANAFTYDNKHTLQCVLHDRKLKSSILLHW